MVASNQCWLTVHYEAQQSHYDTQQGQEDPVLTDPGERLAPEDRQIAYLANIKPSLFQCLICPVCQRKVNCSKRSFGSNGIDSLIVDNNNHFRSTIDNQAIKHLTRSYLLWRDPLKAFCHSVDAIMIRSTLRVIATVETSDKGMSLLKCNDKSIAVGVATHVGNDQPSDLWCSLRGLGQVIMASVATNQWKSLCTDHQLSTVGFIVILFKQTNEG